MSTLQADYDTTTRGETLTIQTFVARVLRSAALREGGELEIVTPFAVIRGTPSDANRVSDLWLRTREQVAEARHEANSRVPSVAGGDLIELENVTVAPFGDSGHTIAFDDLVVFSRDIVGIRSTVFPQMVANRA